MKKNKLSSRDMSSLVNSKINKVEEQVNNFTTPTNTTKQTNSIIASTNNILFSSQILIALFIQKHLFGT